MTKIIMTEDCGNSPKNIFLKDLTIALAKGDVKFSSKSVSDDIVWSFIGGRTFQGKSAFAERVKQLATDKAMVVTLHHISSHGISGAVNGLVKLKSGRLFAFCDVFTFKNTKGEKVKAITSYVIETKSTDLL